MANWEKLALNFDSNCCTASTWFPLSSSSTLFQSITEKFNLIPSPPEARVAVLVDCDNTTPDILEHALKVVAQFGRVVVRRGYGNHDTLAGKWQERLLRLAFTPCLQYQFASGKNTSDIALA
ncbi:MAG: NYN domain-containing protein, partial [Burkholderiales bacterium]